MESATNQSNRAIVIELLWWSNNAAYMVIFILGLANFIVIAAVFRNRKMQSVTNIYIVNLSIADAMMICTIPLLLTQFIKKTWVFGPVVCKLYWIAEQTNKYGSVMFLTILSVDRYLAICRPLKSIRCRTKVVALIIVFITYIGLSVLLTPVYIYARPYGTRCLLVWGEPGNETNQSKKSLEEANYFYFTLVFTFIAPIVVMLFFYSLVLHRLNKLSNKSTALHGERTTACRKQSTEAHYRRVTRMIFAVIICHVICWTPCWINNYVARVKPELFRSEIVRKVSMFIMALPYLNSALNPILYGATNSNYRKTFRNIICCIQRGVEAYRRSSASHVPPFGLPKTNDGSRRMTIHDSIAAAILELQAVATMKGLTVEKNEAEVIYHSVITGDSKL